MNDASAKTSAPVVALGPFTPTAVETSRNAHLQMLQTVITRMGTNAFSTKTWAIGVLAAALAYNPVAPVGQHPVPGQTPMRVAWLLLPAIVFWWLDARYLWRERLFRRLYEAVVAGTAPVFSMDTRPYRAVCPGILRTFLSPAVLAVHILTVAAVLVKAGWLAWVLAKAGVS